MTCMYLHFRFAKRETKARLEWYCTDCGAVLAKLPVRAIRNKTAEQKMRIEALCEAHAGMVTP